MIRSRFSRLFSFLAVLVCAMLIGCDRGVGPANAEEPEKAKKEQRLPKSEKPAEVEKPKMKAYAQAEASKVGVLPQGVGLAVGESAPDVQLLDSEGHHLKLGLLTAAGNTLLVFYRGGWCPYCNFQIHELVQAIPEFKKRGVMPVAVSVDKIQESAKTKAAHAIPFPVLTDPDLKLHSAFGVGFEIDEATVARLKKMGLDLEAASGRKHHTIAVPSMFLIDTSGTIRWAHAELDYKTRPTTAQVLAAIDEVGLEKKAPPQ